MRRAKRTIRFLTVALLLLLVLSGCGPKDTTGTKTQAAGDTGGGGGPAPGDQTTPPPGDGADSVPDPPGGLEALHVPIFDVFIKWLDNSDNELGFRVYRRRVDIPEPPVPAGETGPDETEFHDADVFCGATYQYMVAAFNDAGESLALSACWQIKLPPCPATRGLDYTSGASQGFNFLEGTKGNINDLYMSLSPDGRVVFMADLDGQQGLLDLGDLGGIPLPTTPMPLDPAFLRDGVQAMVGHFYIAQARDGESLIIFRLEQLGDAAELLYIIWQPGTFIEFGPCEGAGSPGAPLPKPGGPCVSGDGVCDPTCTPPTPDQIGTPPPTGDGPTTQQDCQPYAGNATEYNNCLFDAAQVQSLMSGFPTIAAMIATPTYTDRDYDCSREPCISGDDICNPICDTSTPLPDGMSQECFDYDGDGSIDTCCVGDGYSTPICTPVSDDDCDNDPCIDGDGVCEPGCDIGTPDLPGAMPDCIDTDGDGAIDTCCFGDGYSTPICTPVLDIDCTDDGDGGDNGDGSTNGGGPCVCGDGICDPICENTDLCPQDCQCVDDGVCSPGEGTNCRDCGTTAGGCGNPCSDSSQCAAGLSCSTDGVCWEPCACEGKCGGPTPDCGYCGDYKCQSDCGETYSTCPIDCSLGP